jgi:hypothetical protein
MNLRPAGEPHSRGPTTRPTRLPSRPTKYTVEVAKIVGGEASTASGAPQDRSRCNCEKTAPVHLFDHSNHAVGAWPQGQQQQTQRE